LPESIKNMLDKELNKIPAEYKKAIYSKVLSQIDILVSRLKQSSQTTKVVEKINLLL
jgi:hypothetical protein